MKDRTYHDTWPGVTESLRDFLAHRCDWAIPPDPPAGHVLTNDDRSILRWICLVAVTAMVGATIIITAFFITIGRAP